MSNVRPHELHQVIRSWLLAEDPYGMSAQSATPGGRIEPPMMDTNPRSGKARGAGEAAVADALAQPPPDPRAPAAGESAVARALGPQVGSEAFEGTRDPRAQAWGETAVGRATGPDVGSEAFQASRSPAAQSQGESAVDRALNPPTGSGMGMWAPGEAADTASAVGQQAVEGALAKKARGKIAKGRLKDPVDEDDKSPE